MIRELRLRHRCMIPVLGLISIGVFTAAINVRKPIPEMDSNPLAQGLLPVPADTSPLGVLFESQEWILSTGVYPGHPPIFEVTVLHPPKLADPLLYWTETDFSQARLIGPLPAQGTMRYPLPAMKGTLILYSLAQQEILDEAPVHEGGSI